MIEVKVEGNHISGNSDGEDVIAEAVMATHLLADLIAEYKHISIEKAMSILCAAAISTNATAAKKRERVCIYFPKKGGKKNADD